MLVPNERIPYAFARDRSRLSWRDIRFGLTNELLEPEGPVACAADLLAELTDTAPESEASPELVELAGLDQAGSTTMDLVERLAEREPPFPESDIRDKWLYLVLAWIYEHRHDTADPLGRVEEVYADFDYPEQTANFVRYLPMEGPAPGSREAAERRLFERWKAYLDKAASTYAGARRHRT